MDEDFCMMEGNELIVPYIDYEDEFVTFKRIQKDKNLREIAKIEGIQALYKFIDNKRILVSTGMVDESEDMDPIFPGNLGIIRKG